MLRYDGLLEGGSEVEHVPAAGDMFSPKRSVRIETERSLWWIVPNEAGGGWYLRTGKSEAGRERVVSIEGRLDDGRWVGYEHATWSNEGLEEPSELRLHILPLVGPKDGYGIVTGVVTKVQAFGDMAVAN
jgi:hypothetical protein